MVCFVSLRLYMYHLFIGIYITDLPILFRAALLALGQSYAHAYVKCQLSTATPKDMGQLDRYSSTIKHNKAITVCIFPRYDLYLHKGPK